MSYENIFEKIKRAVRIDEIVELFGVNLDRHGKALCPFHKEDTPSFSVKRKENIFKCFGCGISGDAVDFVAKLKGVEPLEAAKLIAEFYRIDTNGHGEDKRNDKSLATKIKGRVEASKAAKTQVKDYITSCIAAVSDTDYFKKRSLSDDIIRKFFLGFDKVKQAVVIPYSSKLDYYQTRSIDGKEFRKPPTGQAGQEPLWNLKALAFSGAVFVVESPICALSIIQCGGQAVSICGSTGGEKLLREVRGKKLKCTFVLSLDNDEPGQKAQAELANQLFELNQRFIPFNIAGDCKDPNELLMEDPIQLSKNIAIAEKAARDKYRTKKDSISADELFEQKHDPPRTVVENLIVED